MATQVDPKKNEFGKELMALLEKHGYTNYFIGAVGKDIPGVALIKAEESDMALAIIALLMQAAPDYFLFMEQIKFSAYLRQLMEASERYNEGGGAADLDELQDYIASGKFKN